MKNTLLTFLLLSFSLSHSFAQNGVGPTCTELFFSEYVEGSYNNKALEIYNPTGAAISLDGAYRIVRWENGSTTADLDIRYVQGISGSIPAYGTYVAFLDKRNPNATGADTMLFSDLLTIANAVNGGFYSPVYDSDAALPNTEGSNCLSFNGDDAFSLQKKSGANWINVDIFGVIGERPLNGNGGTSPNGGWTNVAPYTDGQGAYWTKDQTLVRKASVETGTTVNPQLNSWDVSVQWDSLALNTFTGLGAHDCACNANAISENSLSAKTSVYPNPATDNFFVKSSENISKVELWNVSGQLVAIINAENKKAARILIPGVSAGLYIAVIHTEAGKAVKKVTIR